MRFKRNCSIVLTILAFFTLCSPLFAQNAGATIASFYNQMPIMYRMGITYSTPNITFPGTVPTTATTTMVAWTWGFSGGTAPAGLNVQLCNVAPSQERCLDISNTPHGTTWYFKDQPLSAGPQYVIRMRVPGSGPMIALYPPNTDELILNYEYN